MGGFLYANQLEAEIYELEHRRKCKNSFGMKSGMERTGLGSR